MKHPYRKHQVRIEESSKTVQIKDPRGKLEYIVYIWSQNETLPDSSDVVELYYTWVKSAEIDPQTGEYKPIGNPDQFTTAKDAEEDFHRKIRNYRVLVEVKNRPVDDIQVYAEKIGYHKIDPDCCMNCMYCSRKYDKCASIHHLPYGRYHLVCENPLNFTFFENFVDPKPYGRFMNPDFNRGFHPSMHDPCHDGCHGPHPGGGWELAPPFDPLYHYAPGRPRPTPEFYSLEVRPRVDINGVCKNYKRRSPDQDKNPTIVFQDGEPPTEGGTISAENVIGLHDYVVDTIDQIHDGLVDRMDTIDLGNA